ncbi:MAG: (Fe-S)-binding protein [Promethearchaeota archaeon]
MSGSPPPSSSDALDQFAKVSRLCSLCARMCRHACPTHVATRSDACSPVGRALVVELYRGHKTALTETPVDRLYQCTLCGACKAWCKPGHELPRIIELARERVIQEHRAPLGIIDLDQTVSKHNNVYSEPHEKRFASLAPVLEQQHSGDNVIYFVGCTTAYRHPEIATAAIHVLNRLGVTAHILQNEVCCGSPLVRAGYTETARTLARQNVEAIATSGIRTVLTTCPGCARALKHDYPKLNTPLPGSTTVFHITEFLAKRRRQLQRLLTSPTTTQGSTSTAVTYHDPCHLGRELGVYNPPRQLLQLLPGIRLVEFQNTRDHADCCGAGAVLPKTFPQLAAEIAHRRLDDAAQTGASLLISSCPNCKQHLTSHQTPSSAMPFLDLMELLARALK